MVRHRDSRYRGFVDIARKMKLMEDEKAGVRRTAYMNVVAVKYMGTQVYIVNHRGMNFDYQ